MKINKIQLAKSTEKITNNLDAWAGVKYQTIKFIYSDGSSAETLAIPSYMNFNNDELMEISRAEFGRDDIENTEYYPA